MSKRKRERNRDKLAQKMLIRQDVNTVRDTRAVRIIEHERARRERVRSQMVQNAIQRKLTGEAPESPIPIDQLLNNPDYIKYDPMQVHIDRVRIDDKYHAIVLVLHPQEGKVEVYRHSVGVTDEYWAMKEIGRVLPLVPILHNNEFKWPFYDEFKGNRKAAARERRQRRAEKQAQQAKGIKNAKKYGPGEAGWIADTIDTIRERTEHQLVLEQTSQAEVSDNG
jgi:hypothetical protein